MKKLIICLPLFTQDEVEAIGVVHQWCHENGIPSLHFSKVMNMGSNRNRFSFGQGRTTTLLVRESDYPLVTMRFPNISVTSKPDGIVQW